MLIRTVSQLPNASHTTYNAAKNDLIEIQEYDYSSKYSSKKTTVATLATAISAMSDGAIATKYGLAGQNVTTINNNVNNILNGSIVIDGQKTFKKWPKISSVMPAFDGDVNTIPNYGIVSAAISEQPIYFSTTSSLIAEGDPMPTMNSLDFKNTIGKGKFYFWRIDTNDSSKTVYDAYSQTTDGYEEMRDTGNLVMWGWLADKGDVAPEMAWVGLFSPLKFETSTVAGNTDQTRDFPIAIQPWIRGQYATTLQYVGFTIPVRKGMRIKIKTGFNVNNQNSGFGQKGTMTFIDGDIPNAFFGYIVK